jgi:peroxiredoxin Q/BCP
MKKLAATVFALFLAFAPPVQAADMPAANAAGMPTTGATAPEFTLPNQEGKDVALKDFRGAWVVLYFYPKDFTGGCSLEAHNFQQDLQKYAALHADILGVSVDTVDSHKSFCAKEGLNFKLLSDAQHQVSETYGSVMPLGGNTLAARHTFLIDPKGVIRKTYAEVKPATHSEEVLADLGKLQAEDKAPAKP